MSTNKWQRAEDLLEQVLERGPEERADYLAQECGGDAELRTEVESLLAHHESASPDFLRPPEAPLDVKRPMILDGPDPRIGTSVGGYLIESVIASGGMGTVYEAIQAEPHRAVALKVLHRHVASQSALRRFRFESQILAHLRHPNIAQVFVAGMHEEGSVQVPYFAMEYVPEARTIIDYAAGKKLSTRERLELFAQVCEAVHHGHQKGIIHRDLKPGNILVDSSGQPKIIDFGVARSTDSDIAMTTMQTDVGQIIGTLQYMSPEQCDAVPQEIDTRSDVYSLGGVLYELLTERLPYDVSHMTIHSATRLICEQPPTKPTEFDRSLHGDVETIMLKALEKDREKRYQSSAELAGDVRRFLRGEPIDARPPTAWTRGVRWVAQRPVKATVSVCLAMAAIIIGATFLAVLFLNLRPYEIVRYRGDELIRNENNLGSDVACLLARNRNTLYTWGGNPDSIAFAALVDRPDEFGGGKLAVVGYSLDEAGKLAGSLSAYEVGEDLDTPKWSRRIETKDILSELRQDRGFVGGRFRVYRCMIADVFPGAAHPGVEIVAMFSLPYSQRVIRVYDLTGKRLYEAWHDGSLAALYWMAKAGLLVFAGDNAWVGWDRFGNAVSTQSNPLVVFALRPKPGEIKNKSFLNDPDVLALERRENLPSTAWYNCIYCGETPATWNEIKEILRLESAEAVAPGQFVRLAFVVNEELEASMSMLVDSLGNVVPGTHVATDPYTRNQVLPDDDPKKLPDPKDFHLRPMTSPTSQPVTWSPTGSEARP